MLLLAIQVCYTRIRRIEKETRPSGRVFYFAPTWARVSDPRMAAESPPFLYLLATTLHFALWTLNSGLCTMHLRHRKTKGEYAESAFMTRAIGLGFTVCRPFGDNHRFDFLVFAPGNRIARVQVKSCWTRVNNAYYLNAQGAYHRRYTRRDCDFIAGYVVPQDAWYVIPIAAIRSRMAVVFPHIPHSRGRLEKYRDSWHLLRTRTKCRQLPQCHPERS